jgi:hypothetical protein
MVPQQIANNSEIVGQKGARDGEIVPQQIARSSEIALLKLPCLVN